MDDVLWKNYAMRYIRKVVFIRDRVAKWFPAPDIINQDGTTSKVEEPDGKEYFWSDDKIFTDMSSLKDIHGNRQWKITDGKAKQETDKLTNEQKENETSRRQKYRRKSKYWIGTQRN